MKTLIVYDNEGCIIQQITGSYRIPIGVPYIELELPSNKIVKGINIDTKQPILIDIPKSQIELLKEELAQNTKEMAKKDLQIEQLQKDLADLTKQIANGGR